MNDCIRDCFDNIHYVVFVFAYKFEALEQP